MVFIAAREYGHSKVTAALEDKHKEYSKTEFSNNIRELGKLSAVGHNQLLREYSSAAGGLLHEVPEVSGFLSLGPAMGLSCIAISHDKRWKTKINSIS